MKYILLITLLLTGCVSKIVKEIKTEHPDNSNIEMVVPFTNSKITNTTELNHSNPLDMAVIIFTVVIIISFLPYILATCSYVLEKIYTYIQKMIK